MEKALVVGDRVRLRRFPRVKGKVWDTGWRDYVIVKWNDREENAYVREQDLQRLIPRRKAR
jgi:hypothetical protein